MNLLVVLLALSDKLFLTLLNVGGVNNGLALLSWHLSLMLLGNLVALVFNMVLAVRSRRVTLVTSLSLVISTRMVIHNMGVMTNNLRTVVNLSVLFLTMCGDNFLAFFNIGGIYNDIIFFMTFFSVTLLWLLVALLVWLTKALEVVMVRIMVFFVVSLTRLSFSLVISMRMMINNMCVMTNNLFTVMGFMMFLVTLSDEFFFTVFNVGGINNGLTFSSRNFSLMLLGNLMALMIYMVLTVWSR